MPFPQEVQHDELDNEHLDMPNDDDENKADTTSVVGSHPGDGNGLNETYQHIRHYKDENGAPCKLVDLNLKVLHRLQLLMHSKYYPSHWDQQPPLEAKRELMVLELYSESIL